MYRSVGVSRRLVSTPGRPVIRVVTRSRYRRFATTATETPKSTTLPLSNPSITTTPKSNSAPPPPPPPPKPKKSGFVRRVLLFTSVFAATFYGGSVYFSLQNEGYHDFFVDSVPLGQTFMEIAEQAGYGDSSRPIREKFDARVTKTSAKVKEAHERAQAKKAKVAEKLKDEKERLQGVKEQLKTQKVKTEVKKGVETVKETAKKTQEVVVTGAVALSDDVRMLVSEAEDALKGIYPTQTSRTLPVADKEPEAPQPLKKDAAPASGSAPLPLDWEPAPGYNVGEAAKTLSAPAVADLDGSDPMLAHLASTIAQLGAMASNPAAAKILDTAKADLAELNAKLSKMKNEEKTKLESALDERTKEFQVKMLEMEMDAQDKIDGMDEEWRKYFDSEKKRVVETYRNKLNSELETQSELINQRLKEEVIAQGIEMQRRWIREVKVRVEQERGGRLAKLDELSASIARLERLTSDNALYLDDNLRAHALWSALRALSTTALSSTTRTPFREELRVLRHISSARDDPVITAALDTLDGTDVPDTGIEPLKDLSAWFDTSVVPHVSAVALVPDRNAGVLSYLASSLVSKFQFKREGKVEGSDVLSVLARARYYLSERDLDSAARELNQLGGPSKELLKDWLDAARRRLEVEQALEVVEAQAKLASLLVVA